MGGWLDQMLKPYVPFINRRHRIDPDWRKDVTVHREEVYARTQHERTTAKNYTQTER